MFVRVYAFGCCRCCLVTVVFNVSKEGGESGGGGWGVRVFSAVGIFSGFCNITGTCFGNGECPVFAVLVLVATTYNNL